MAQINPGTHAVMDSSRPVGKKLPVYHPDGHMEMHTQDVVNDLVRHGTMCETGETDANGKPARVRLHWTLQDPTIANQRLAQRAKVLAHSIKNQAEGVAASHVSKVPVAPEAAMNTPQLTDLRKMFSDMGGIPDPTWGLKRLQAAIEAKRSGAPLPADEDDE